MTTNVMGQKKLPPIVWAEGDEIKKEHIKTKEIRSQPALPTEHQQPKVNC